MADNRQEQIRDPCARQGFPVVTFVCGRGRPAITEERKRVPQRLGFASVETLDDAHRDIQLCRQE